MAVRASDGGKGCLTVPVWRGVRLRLGAAGSVVGLVDESRRRTVLVEKLRWRRLGL